MMVAMWVRWLTAGGMFILGVLATMLIEKLTGTALNVLIRERFKRRSRQRLLRLGVDDDLIRRGSEALYIHQFVPGGYEPRNIELTLRPAQDDLAALRGSLASADPRALPGPVDDLVRAAEQRNAEYDDPSTPTWNGETVCVERIESFSRRGQDEVPALRLVVAPGRYGTSQVCTEAWQQWFDERDGRLPAALPEIYDGVPGMLNSIGLNATLVTDDDKLVLVRRNARMSSARSGLHISVNEGMLPSDRLTAGHLDPHLGLVRGVEEELGIIIDRRTVAIHTAMIDMRRYQFGLLGHIDLSGTQIDAAAIKEARAVGLAKDKAENRGLELVEWDYETVRSWLAKPDWIAHGWLNLLLSAIGAFPRQARELSSLLTAHTQFEQAREDAVRARHTG